jgi:hypothetical protein
VSALALAKEELCPPDVSAEATQRRSFSEGGGTRCDTLKQVVNATNLPELNISGKEQICKGESHPFVFSGAGSYTLNQSALSQPSITMQPTISTTYVLFGADTISGCTAGKVFVVRVNACTNILETSSDMVSVYPNPHEGLVTVSTKEPALIEVCSVTGTCVYSDYFQAGEHSIRIPNQNTFYILRVSTPDRQQYFKLLGGK